MSGGAHASTADEAVEEKMVNPPSPAIAARSFGWLMLSLLAAFLINVVLTFWADLPGVAPLVGWQGNGDGGIGLSIAQAALYVVLAALAIFYVTRTPNRSLRADEDLVADFNAMLVRMAFWVVFFVGLADAAVSFLRVEGLLESYFGEDIAGDLGRSSYRGVYVHVPVIILGILIGAFTRTLGFHWLALLVVVAELIIVFSRFIFSYEQAFMADLVRFWYGSLFLFASAYTLYDDGHVRVDLLYAGFRNRTKGAVNKWGAVLLGIPLCWVILFFGMWTKSSVIVGPILVFETTQAGFGLYVKYFMAGFLGVFAVTMHVQFISQFFGAVADTRGEGGAHETHPEMM
ncbi:MAG: TRAP transporter small permease subunit [Pseudomonadota bacterium]